MASGRVWQAWLFTSFGSAPYRGMHRAPLLCHLHCLAASSGLGSSTDTVMVRCRTWQAIERLLSTDAVLLGRRLITCGAHAAAEELCARRQMPADFVIEVSSHIHPLLAMQHPARAASIFTALS